MSLQGVTAAAARVISEVPGVKAAYAADPQSQPGVLRPPADISDVPVVTVSYESFELTIPGKPEHIAHLLRADIWTRGRTSAEGEALYLTITSGIIAQFRSRVGLFGQAMLAKVIRGGPPRAEDVNQQPFIVFPVYIRVQELTVNTYTLGPSS